ncbi:MAG: response regulator [Acidimicrobiia bacterium]|nr:response regulator [Acidimicrobiia bacterium]
MLAVRSRPVVVVIEDDPAIADLVELYLRREGYRVHQAGDAEAGLRTVEQRRPALVILDVGLPGPQDGIDVCRAIRAASDLPIVMLTARDDEVDRILGLEMGADDYVVKPFSARELMVRVKNILRRAAGPAAARRRILDMPGDVAVDLDRREARRAGTPVALTSREFDLLAFLAGHRGLALSRRQLLDGVWGAGWVGDERTVDVHVGQLRRKLGGELQLATVWGVGYRLD